MPRARRQRGAKIRRDRLRARTAASTASSSSSRMARTSARPCLDCHLATRLDPVAAGRGASSAGRHSPGRRQLARRRGSAKPLLGFAPVEPDRREDGADERQRDHHEEVADDIGEGDPEGAERPSVRRKVAARKSGEYRRRASKTIVAASAPEQLAQADLPVEQEVGRPDQKTKTRAPRTGRTRPSDRCRRALPGRPGRERAPLRTQRRRSHTAPGRLPTRPRRPRHAHRRPDRAGRSRSPRGEGHDHRQRRGESVRRGAAERVLHQRRRAAGQVQVVDKVRGEDVHAPARRIDDGHEDERGRQHGERGIDRDRAARVAAGGEIGAEPLQAKPAERPVPPPAKPIEQPLHTAGRRLVLGLAHRFGRGVTFR